MNGLEALKRIRQETAPNTYCKDFDKEECCNTIEKELKDGENYKKALNVLKKYINPFQIKVATRTINYADYNELAKNYNLFPLTKGEYELFKEVMK